MIKKVTKHAKGSPFKHNQFPKNPQTSTISHQFSSFLTRKQELHHLSTLSENDKNHNFTLQTIKHYPETNQTLYKFKHDNLGLVHYHVSSPETLNTFSINFKTAPEDNKGLPHILQRMILAGSQKYPVRDAFKHMNSRTIGEASEPWTGPDYSSYPFSTSSQPDFYNLLRLYADSVFRPSLNREDFLDQIWRLDFSQTGDPSTNLVYRGGLLEEMSRMVNNPETLYMEAMKAELLRGSCYEYSAGGVPELISEVGFEELVGYFGEAYHPRNATLFSFGDLSPLRHQEVLQEEFLRFFENGEFGVGFGDSQRVGERLDGLEDGREALGGGLGVPDLSKPRKVALEAPFGTREFYSGIGFLCKELGTPTPQSSINSPHIPQTDEYTQNIEILKMQFLSFLLFSTPGSPLFEEYFSPYAIQPLSFQPTGFCPGHGFESSILHPYFTLGLSFAPKSPLNNNNDLQKVLDEVRDRILDSIDQLSSIRNGISRYDMATALNYIEATARSGVDSAPGMNVLVNSLDGIVHRRDSVLERTLNLSEYLFDIRDQIEDNEDVLGSLIERFLSPEENSRHVELVYAENIDNRFSGDFGVSRGSGAVGRLAWDARRLKGLESGLTDEKIREILKENLELQKFRNQIQDVNQLPLLDAKEIETDLQAVEYQIEPLNDQKQQIFFFHSEKFSESNVTKIQLKFDLSYIPETSLGYLYLLEKFFLNLSTITYKNDELAELLRIHVADLQFVVKHEARPEDASEVAGYAVLSFVALDSNLGNAMDLVSSLLLEPDFSDLETISKLLKIYSSEAANDLVLDVVGVAREFSAASGSPVYRFSNKLANNRFICDLGSKVLDTLDVRSYLMQIGRNFDEIFHFLMRGQCLSYAVHTSPGMMNEVKFRVDMLNRSLKSTYRAFDEPLDPKHKLNVSRGFEPKYSKNYFVLPTHTSTVLETYFVPGHFDPSSPRLQVAAKLLEMEYLKEPVLKRSKAKALEVHFDSYAGVLTLISKEDPKTLQTLTNFERGLQALTESLISDELLNQAKLRIAKRVFKPEIMVNQGVRDSFYNPIDFLKQSDRLKQVMSVKKQEVIDAVAEHLLKALSEGRTQQTIFGVNSEKLPLYVKNGWKIERFSQGLSLNSKKYESRRQQGPDNSGKL